MNLTPDKLFTLTGFYLALFANKYGSKTTVGELMAMCAVLQAHFGQRGRCTASDVVRETGLAKSTVNAAITRLVNRGFITEAVDPDDRRVKRLSPGPAHSDLEDPAVEISAVRKILS